MANGNQSALFKLYRHGFRTVDLSKHGRFVPTPGTAATNQQTLKE